MDKTEKTNLMILKFTVNGQRIYYDEKNRAAADSRKYLYAAFNFSEEWQNPKFALFSSDINQEIPVAVLLDETDGCYVPIEIIKAPGFFVSVFCEYGDKLITAEKRQVKILPSGYSNKIELPIFEKSDESDNPDESEEPEEYEDPEEFILGEILDEAENVNRYLYTANTVSVFDSAYKTAKSAENGSNSEQQAALISLREAIDGLTGAEFSFAAGTIVMEVGKGTNSYPLAQYVNYDGIGTVTGSSSNPAVIQIIDDIIARPLKSGMSALTFSVPYFTDLTKSINIFG